MMPGSGGSDAPVIGLTDAEVLLEHGVGVARAAGFDATGRRVEIDGKTSETIVETAEREDAPVIVMGQRGRSGLKLALLGTVSRDVINAFHRPVLMVGATSAKR
jgi:nucleotide-binding universal stress UspA family protein